MDEKMRATRHNGRGRAAHNDRSMYRGGEMPENIDPEGEHEDRTWLDDLSDEDYESVIHDPAVSDQTWDATGDMEFAERAFYDLHFAKHLQAQNERYESRRQTGRIKTMADVYNCRAYCPEETVFQIGDIMADWTDPDVKERLMLALQDQLEYEQEYGKKIGVYTLSTSCHISDETSPHVHRRQVYTYVDDDGEMWIGQEKCLEQAGFDLPKPGKKVSRHNNRKMTYDARMREHWLDVCEHYGFEIEREPLKDQRSKTLSEYVRDRERMAKKRERDLSVREKALEARERDFETQVDKWTKDAQNCLKTALGSLLDAQHAYESLHLQETERSKAVRAQAGKAVSYASELQAALRAAEELEGGAQPDETDFTL